MPYSSSAATDGAPAHYCGRCWLPLSPAHTRATCNAVLRRELAEIRSELVMYKAQGEMLDQRQAEIRALLGEGNADG